MPVFSKKSSLEYIQKNRCLTSRFSSKKSCSHNGDIDRPPQSILTTEYEEVLVTMGNSVEMKSKGNWNKPCEE